MLFKEGRYKWQQLVGDCEPVKSETVFSVFQLLMGANYNIQLNGQITDLHM